MGHDDAAIPDQQTQMRAGLEIAATREIGVKTPCQQRHDLCLIRRRQVHLGNRPGPARQGQRPIGGQGPERVVRQFPDMAIRIGEIAGIAAPEYRFRGFQRPPARRQGGGKGRIHPGGCSEILRQRRSPGAERCPRPPLIRRQIGQPEQAQRQPVHLIERHAGGLISGGPAPRGIKATRPGQIGNPQRHQCHALQRQSHGRSFSTMVESPALSVTS